MPVAVKPLLTFTHIPAGPRPKCAVCGQLAERVMGTHPTDLFKAVRPTGYDHTQPVVFICGAKSCRLAGERKLTGHTCEVCGAESHFGCVDYAGRSRYGCSDHHPVNMVARQEPEFWEQRREQNAAPVAPAVCPECKGSKQYIGLNTIEPCKACCHG